MNDKKHRASALSHLELAAVDLTITALQAKGHTISDLVREDNPREQMADAWADAHHPLIELDDRDREIIAQIKDLASQLTSRTSLHDLTVVRGKIVHGG